MDEDTCATNLMARDARMAALVEREPITPLTARIAALRSAGVSCILVMGGSGDYLGLADCVICMDGYRAADATARARRVHAAAAGAAAGAPAAAAEQAPAAAGGSSGGGGGGSGGGGGGGGGSGGGGGGGRWIPGYGRVAARVPLAVHPSAPAALKVAARGLHQISYGSEEIALAGVEQLVDRSQTRAVADALRWLHARVAAAGAGGGGGGAGGARPTLARLLDDLEAALDAEVGPSSHLTAVCVCMLLLCVLSARRRGCGCFLITTCAVRLELTSPLSRA